MSASRKAREKRRVSIIIYTVDFFTCLLTQTTDEWLNAYTEANPIRSMYAFCINPKYPGYFDLCFKAGASAKVAAWPVKVIPNAFELQRHPYPDMRALKNGFKLLFSKASGVAKR